MRLSGKMVLRVMFGSKRHEDVGEWRRLRIDELYDLYSSTNIRCYQIKKKEMGRAFGTYGDRRRAYRAEVGRPNGTITTGRPRRRGRIL
jgi:hypothetical protein